MVQWKYLIGICFSLSLLMSACQRRYEVKGKSDVESLMEAERAASALSASEGFIKSMLANLGDSGVLLRPQHMPMNGNAARLAIQSNPDTGFVLTWEPIEAIVEQTGELGYTYGTYTYQIKASGKQRRGTYATVWRRDKEGKWKMMLDTGNPGLEPEADKTKHQPRGKKDFSFQ